MIDRLSAYGSGGSVSLIHHGWRHAREPDTRDSGHYIMCWSFMLSTGKRSTEISTTGVPPLFCHQCDVPFFSGATSPALCTIGTAQLLAYSTISPETT